MRWGELATLEFVKLYMNSTCLWNMDHPAYRSLPLREKAYLQLAKDTKPIIGRDISISEIKGKIKSLRSVYKQELNKILTKSVDPEHIYKPRIPWFDIMDKFLQGSPKKILQDEDIPNDEYSDWKRDDVNDQPYDVDLNEISLGENDVLDGDIKTYKRMLSSPEMIFNNGIKRNKTDNSECVDVSNLDENEDPLLDDNRIKDLNIDSRAFRGNISPHPISLKKRTVRYKMKHAYDPNLSSSHSSSSDDEFDAYGKYVATQLKKMSLPTALQSQVDIQNVIRKARLSEL